MSKPKNFIEVKKDEPELYRICHELKVHGKSILENNNGNKNKVNRKFGVRANSLIEQKLICPMAKTVQSRKYQKNLRIWATQLNVKVIEEKGVESTFFKFYKI
jgi:hypothetical protein